MSQQLLIPEQAYSLQHRVVHSLISAGIPIPHNDHVNETSTKNPGKHLSLAREEMSRNVSHMSARIQAQMRFV